MNAFGSPTQMLVRHYITRASNAKSTTSSNLLAKLNRVEFTEFFDDDTVMLKRIQFELLRVVDAHTPRGNGRKARAARREP